MKERTANTMWKRGGFRNKRPASELGSAILEYFKKFGFEREYYQGRVMDEWAEIVGEAMASRVKITSFEGEVITVKTENSVWKNEVYLRKKEIMSLVNSRFNQKIVSDINIR